MPSKKTTVKGDRLLTSAEAAERLGTTVAVLHKWRHFNQGPKSFKVGARLRYRESALEEYLAAREQATTRGEVA